MIFLGRRERGPLGWQAGRRCPDVCALLAAQQAAAPYCHLAVCTMLVAVRLIGACASHPFGQGRVDRETCTSGSVPCVV